MKIPEYTNLQWVGIYLILLPLLITTMMLFTYSTVSIYDALEMWFIALVGLGLLAYEQRRLTK